jgi:hypothetical protein
VLLFDMLVHANKSALKHAEITFEGVGVDLLATLALAHIFLGMVHSLMIGHNSGTREPVNL